MNLKNREGTVGEGDITAAHQVERIVDKSEKKTEPGQMESLQHQADSVLCYVEPKHKYKTTKHHKMSFVQDNLVVMYTLSWN